MYLTYLTINNNKLFSVHNSHVFHEKITKASPQNKDYGAFNYRILILESEETIAFLRITAYLVAYVIA